MSHVAHYLDGNQLRTGMRQIYSWLKPSGVFCFQALTPYANPYVWNMAEADKKSDALSEWPGYFSEKDKFNQRRARPKADIKIATSMPNYGHPIHPHILERELKMSGFSIAYIGYSSFLPALSKSPSPLSYEDHEAFVKTPIAADQDAEDKIIEEFKLKMKYPSVVKLEQDDFDKVRATWLKLILKDRKSYHYNMANPHESAIPLATMDVVIAIARKESDEPD